MKAKELIKFIRAQFMRVQNSLFGAQQKKFTFSLIVLSVFLLFFFIKICIAIVEQHMKAASVPMMIRQGSQIKIPVNSPLRAQIIIKTVGTLILPHIVTVPAVVEADPAYTVNILPPLSGRLIELSVKLGDIVKKDQVLAVISAPDLAQANADYDSANSAFKFASAALDRAQKVNNAGANSIKDIELARNAYTQALAELKRSKARLKILGENTFRKLTIKAPLSGRITAINYGRGSYITDLTAPLLTVANFKSVWVTANIPENLAGTVMKGQRVAVTLPAYPKKTWYGKVSFVSPALDPVTRRNQTRIAFKNFSGKLQPNMFATVNISLPQPSSIVIPISSIFMNDDTTSVYIETSPWVFERREVLLGDEDGTNVRVLSGLAVGERVVTVGGIFIND